MNINLHSIIIPFKILNFLLNALYLFCKLLVLLLLHYFRITFVQFINFVLQIAYHFFTVIELLICNNSQLLFCNFRSISFRFNVINHMHSVWVDFPQNIFQFSLLLVYVECIFILILDRIGYVTDDLQITTFVCFSLGLGIVRSLINSR